MEMLASCDCFASIRRVPCERHASVMQALLCAAWLFVIAPGSFFAHGGTLCMRWCLSLLDYLHASFTFLHVLMASARACLLCTLRFLYG
mmetsp:Transcript_33115/g.98498  ORF Transcript_33115/g.98498 Transcript_33115/m.98498 type:complete len:89 (+) Transcript_33115:765-1031(+)